MILRGTPNLRNGCGDVNADGPLKFRSPAFSLSRFLCRNQPPTTSLPSTGSCHCARCAAHRMPIWVAWRNGPSAVPARRARGNCITPKETDCCCQQRPARDDTPRRSPRRFVAGGSPFLFTPSGVDRNSLGAGRLSCAQGNPGTTTTPWRLPVAPPARRQTPATR